jgi:hypothetical protein
MGHWEEQASFPAHHLSNIFHSMGDRKPEANVLCDFDVAEQMRRVVIICVPSVGRRAFEKKVCIGR